MKFQLFFLTFAVLTLQGESGVLQGAGRTLDKVTNVVTKPFNDFNNFVERIAEETSHAISKRVKNVFNPIYKKIGQLAGRKNFTCLRTQRRQADEDIENLILDGTHCISDIATDISNNTLDVIYAIAEDRYVVSTVLQSFRNCSTKNPSRVASCMISETTNIIREVGRDVKLDAKGGFAIGKLIAFAARIPTNLSICVIREIAAANLNVVRILAALRKC